MLPRPKSYPASHADDEFTTAYASPFRPRRSFGTDSQDEFGSNEKPSNHLSNRYNFNASLLAAVNTARTFLGERSGLTEPQKQQPQKQTQDQSQSQSQSPPQSQTQSQSQSQSPPQSQPKQLRLVTSPSKPSPSPQAQQLPHSHHHQAQSKSPQPSVGSIEYQTIIDKFCFFTAGSNTGSTRSQSASEPLSYKVGSIISEPPECLGEKPGFTPDKAREIEQIDGPNDSGSDSNSSSVSSSPSNSPPSPRPVENVESKASSRSSSASANSRGLSPRLVPYHQSSPSISIYQEVPLRQASPALNSVY